MPDWKNLATKSSVLVLNRPNVITDNNFYIEIFRIPEVLNKLRQYREVLNDNDITIPIWVYCITQELNNLVGGPQSFMLDFLINLGLFDRYVAKKGWPKYILGSEPLMSVIACEISFEERALLLSNAYCQNSEELQLYQASSYYNHHTGSFCLTSLKRRYKSFLLKEILLHLQKKKNSEDLTDWIVQLLSPHDEDLMDDLKSYGLSPQEFLEWDRDLKWLWPKWKKIQVQFLKNKQVQIC